MVFAIEVNQNNFAPAKILSVATLMKVILPLVILVMALVFLVVLFRSAFQILTAGDNQEAVSKAQKTISFAVLGLVLVVTSFLLVRIIGMILKVQFPL
jgi:hypothetical protein